MRALFVCMLIALLAGCGEAPDGSANAAEPAVLTGEYRAASDTARQITGDVSIERAGLIFARGVVLYTRVLEPRRGVDVISTSGDSYAAAALGPADLRVELRRVTQQTVPEGREGLCGELAPAYVALAFEERATTVALLVFAGDEPPSPRATQSHLCATFAYAAPDGARTRQGVLLQ